jgi:hemolysin activation/secretion protein
VGCSWALPLAAFAQQAPGTTSPALTTPRSFAPPTTRPGSADGLSLDPARPQTASDRLQVTIGGVLVEGTLPALTAETERTIASLARRRVTAAQIFEAAAALERAYAEAGFVLVRVVVPPQDLRPGGTLRLLVVNGFVERVDLDRVPEPVRARVQALTAALVDARPLTRAELERRLLLAGDSPGLTLRSSLTPGQQLGGTVLLLEGVHRPFGMELSFENGLSRALGRYSLAVAPTFNSVLGFGEQFYGVVASTPGEFFLERSPRNVAAGGVLLPLGNDGLILNIEGVSTTTYPRVRGEELQTAAEFTRISGRLLYPLIRARAQTLTLRLAFDATEDRQSAPDFDVLLYEDQVRPVRLGFDYSRLFETGTSLNIGTDLSRGLDALGSRGSDNATFLRPISRVGADDTFWKGEARLRVVQTLPASFALEGTMRAQTSFSDPLLTSERFSLGGPRALSGFDSGAIVGDSGWIARGELQYFTALPTSLGSLGMAPYAFAAAGEVFTEAPTAVERARTQGYSYGLGLRFLGTCEDSVMNQAILDLEVARGESNDPGVKDGWRFNIASSIRF